MYVRTFQLSDYAPVSELLREVLSEECCEETMDALGRQLSWDSDLILVAVHEENIAGVIIGTIDDNHGYYYRIAVKREHQRKGIGKMMIHHLKERFLRRKVSKIFVTVDKHNRGILPLYEAAGYGKLDFFHAFERLSIVNG